MSGRYGFTRKQVNKQWHGKMKCACCDLPAVHTLTWKNGWFRGDDDIESVCDSHFALAQNNNRRFWELVAERRAYLDTIIDAQHEETGRAWRGTRRALPPKYAEVTR